MHEKPLSARGYALCCWFSGAGGDLMGQIESFGGSTSDVNEQALKAVGDFIQTVQPGSMVQRFVLLVETIDNDDRWLSAFTAPGQKRWDSMGMLQYGLTLEANTVLEADQDDDPDG